MKKINVQICGGTTCHVMGGDHLFELEDHLPEELRPRVCIEGAHCLGLCGSRNGGQRPPFATIDGTPVADATISSLIEQIARLAREK